MEIKYLSSREVYEKLDMDSCIGLMEEVFAALSNGEVENVVRSMLNTGEGGLLGIMPGLIPSKHAIGAKLITIFHDNYLQGLPSHQGIVAVYDTTNGTLKGICDGTSITAIRTGAVSAVATKYMSRPESTRLALLGSGVQAGTHLDAISRVRDIKEVTVWSNSLESMNSFIDKYSKKYPDMTIKGCETAQEAVKDADIICTVTPSHTPVLKGEWVKAGTHINAVGACARPDRELDSECVRKSKLICDAYSSCMAEAGDYLIPLREGVFGEDHLLGDLGGVVTGKVAVRTSDEDITCFEALGLAAEDVICADWLLRK